MIYTLIYLICFDILILLTFWYFAFLILLIIVSHQLIFFLKQIYLFIVTRFLHNIHQIEKFLPFELTPETTFVEVQEGNSRKIELGGLSWVSR